MNLSESATIKSNIDIETTTLLTDITAIVVNDSDTQSIGTLIIVILSVIAAITVLFFIAIFIDCRQQKIQNERVQKSKRILRIVIPQILKSEDRQRITENMQHVQETDPPTEVV